MINNNFDEVSWAAFQEAAAEKYDFSTCQRPDGSYYGTGGTCRKGSPVNGVPEKEKKSGGGSGGGEYRTRPKGAIESDMKKLTSSGAMNQKGTAGVKAREEHTNLKAELKKPLQGANSKSGGKASGGGGAASSKDVKAADKADKAFQSSQKIQAKTKKLSAEYEKLRGDTSPKATARRKKIMEDVNKNISKQKELQKTIDKAGATPKKPDTSLPAQQRRASAAARARD